jgi:peptide/nickel transport system permease protein
VIQVVDLVGPGHAPHPYYIMALVLLAVFSYSIPIFPFSGAYPPGTAVEFSLSFVLTVLHHSLLPLLSLVLIGIGGWFVRHEVAHLQHHCRRLCGLRRKHWVAMPPDPDPVHHAQRHAAQITGLALQLGMLCSGALIMEVVFGYPGMGALTFQAVMADELHADHGRRAALDRRRRHNRADPRPPLSAL